MATRILVLRPGAIGDTLLTVPALHALRQRFPGARNEMAGNAAALPLLASSGMIDRAVSFDDPRVPRLFMPAEPASDDPFLGLDLAVAWCADPDGLLSRGLAARGASQVVVRTSRPVATRRVHVARYLIETLGPLGVAQDGPVAVPAIRASTGGERQARDELAILGLEGRPFVAIQPGSGSPSKNWPAERFADVIAELEQRHGLPVLVLGGPADGEVIERLEAAAVRPLRLLLHQPLVVVAAILRRARAFLGNDSGISHLAGMLGLPTLALFGPTDPALWAPLGPRVRVLRSEPLTDLGVNRVVGELERILSMNAGGPVSGSGPTR
jgi:ADP-heptose:LPS heptosyltransferase